MSSISNVGSSSTLDTQFAQSLIQQSGSTDGTLNESEFIQLLKSNPQLAQGLASVEGGDSSTTIDQLYQKLDANGDGSVSLSELSAALGTLRDKMQAGGPPPPPPDGSQDGAASATDTDSSSTSDVTGSTAVGQLTTTDASTGTSSITDLSSVATLLEQLLKETQQQGYNPDGSSSTSSSLSVFQTTA